MELVDITAPLHNILVDIQDIITSINNGQFDISHNRMMVLRGKIVMLCTMCGSIKAYKDRTIIELFSNTIRPDITINEIKVNGNKIVTLLTTKKLWIETALESLK